jgi:hypothetical protein
MPKLPRRTCKRAAAQPHPASGGTVRRFVSLALTASVGAGVLLSVTAVSPAVAFADSSGFSLTSVNESSTIAGFVNLQLNDSACDSTSAEEFQIDGVLDGSGNVPASVSYVSGDTATGNSDYRWDTTALSNASHTLQITCTSSVDTLNDIVRHVTVANTAPAVSVTAPTSGQTVSGTISLTASAVAAAGRTVSQVEFVLDGRSYATSYLSPYQVKLDTTQLAEGSHTVAAQATDSAGLVGTSSSLSFAVGNGPPPPIDIKAPAEGASISGDNAALVVMNNTNGCTADGSISEYDIYIDGVLDGSGNVPAALEYRGGDSGGQQLYVFDTTGLDNGSHTIQMDCPYSDPPASAVRHFSIDNIAPQSTVTSPAPSQAVYGTGFVLKASAAAQSAGQHISSVEFLLDGQSYATSIAAPYQARLDTTKLTNGTHTVQAVASDSGDITGSSGVVSFTIANYHTNFTAASSKARVAAGSTALITGRLRVTETGAALSGRSTVLQVRRANTSTWSRVGAVTTASDGTVKYTTPHTSYSTYYRWAWGGQPGAAASTSNQVLLTAVPAVHLSLSTTSARRGSSVRGSVTVSPGNAGQPLVLQVRSSTGTWRTIATGKTTGSSTAVTVMINTPGTWYVRVVRNTDVLGAQCASNTVTLRIT